MIVPDDIVPKKINNVSRQSDSLPTRLQMVLFDAGSASSSRPMAAAAAAAADDRFEHDSRGRSVSRLVIRNIEHSHAGVYTCQPASADAVDVTVHVLNGTVLAVATDGERERGNISIDSRRIFPNNCSLFVCDSVEIVPLDSARTESTRTVVTKEWGYRDRPSGRRGTAAGQTRKKCQQNLREYTSAATK